MLDIKRQKQIAGRILAWYDRHQRSLPWRQTQNPYFIWVSEIMLQQTQVETVIPYYHRFLARFPTVETLAEATLEDVLKAWENLGYYSRARHLHAAAKDIMSSLGGKIPSTQAQLLCLPGIGSYTAAAILSIAFEQQVPAVDGNVRRVLSRLFSIQDPIDKAPARKHIQALAEAMVRVGKPSRFNQGIMDFGATICTPRKPLCGACALDDLCLALKGGLQEVLPTTGKHKPIPHKQMTAGIIADDHGRLLIVQRPIEGLLGGLWKFPGGEKAAGETLENALQNTIEAELGIKVRVMEELTTIKHAYTHFRITLHAFRGGIGRGKPAARRCRDWLWIEPCNLANFPFSKAERKVMAAFDGFTNF